MITVKSILNKPKTAIYKKFYTAKVQKTSYMNLSNPFEYKTMKTHKNIKIAIRGVFGIFLVLFAVLVFHIATYEILVYENATLQISRIDFKEPINSLQVKQINREYFSHLGVKNPSVFAEKKW
jgi:hypothetical protein